jgi:hypothetical protein
MGIELDPPNFFLYICMCVYIYIYICMYVCMYASIERIGDKFKGVPSVCAMKNMKQKKPNLLCFSKGTVRVKSGAT